MYKKRHVLDAPLAGALLISALGIAACSGVANENLEALDSGPDDAEWAELESAILGGTLVNGRAGLVGFGGCTGTMISPTVILTAAHCFPSNGVGFANFDIRYFRPGSGTGSGISMIPNGTISTMTVTHPSYAGSIYYPQDTDHDVGLLILNDINHSRWPNTDYHDYVRVKKDTALPARSTRVDVYGRGYNTDSGGGLGILRKGRFSREDETQYRMEMDANSDFGFCKGDSGGPMLFQSAGLDVIACIHSQSDAFLNAGTCIEQDLVLPDDGYCARTGLFNTENFIADFTSVDCKAITNNGTHDYLRCFDLPFVSDVPDGDRFSRGVATAILMGSNVL